MCVCFECVVFPRLVVRKAALGSEVGVEVLSGDKGVFHHQHFFKNPMIRLGDCVVWRDAKIPLRCVE